MKYLYLVVTLLCATVAPVARATEISNIQNAVVKVFVTANAVDYYRPWQTRGSQSRTGSGCIIAGNRILTNAHVVSDQTFIQVRKESDPTKYSATVEAIGHDCDLAILRVTDSRFFDDSTSLELGDLPQLQDTVTVIGFPVGGDKISVSKGVVSRVETIAYTQSIKKLLAVQIDAAINPGNSGGPVIKDGKLVGIAMQSHRNSQNIGYMIPVPIVEHFLTDLEDSRYDGFPTLGIEFLNTENQALRKYLKIDDQPGGVLVSHVFPFSSASGALQEQDVLLSIDDVPIAMDGTFTGHVTARLGMSHLIARRQMGDFLTMKVSRNGKVFTQDVAIKPYVGLVPPPHHFERPPYYIYGGLVFTVLSSDLLRSWGSEWWEKAPLNLIYYALGNGRFQQQERKEIVVLLGVLPDDINVGYHHLNNQLMSHVNGKPIVSFRDFVLAIETNPREFSTFETENGGKIIINHRNADIATAELLERNNISHQYSADVAGWLRQIEASAL